MSVLCADAKVLRAEGAAAARAGTAACDCPYPADDWRALEWLVGHAGFRGPVPPELTRRARLSRSAVLKKRWEATVDRPQFTGNTCRRRGCGKPVPWNLKISPAKNLRRPCCCDACHRQYAREVAFDRRMELMRTDPQAALRLEQRSGLRPDPELGVLVRTRDAATETRPEPEPRRIVSNPRRTGPITEEMWRAALRGASVPEMRRFMGFDDAQVAIVLKLQRSGGRAA